MSKDLSNHDLAQTHATLPLWTKWPKRAANLNFIPQRPAPTCRDRIQDSRGKAVQEQNRSINASCSRHDSEHPNASVTLSVVMNDGNKSINVKINEEGGLRREVRLPRRLKVSAPLVLSQASPPTMFRSGHHRPVIPNPSIASGQ